MLTPNARRKTPLKKAPSKFARDHPKDSSLGESVRSEICQGEVSAHALKLDTSVRWKMVP